MAIPVWQAGTLYTPGDLVQPASTPAAAPSPPTNPGFESGDVSWAKGTGFTIVNGASGPTSYSGTWKAVAAFTGETEIVNANVVAVVPGQVINASCVAAQSATADYNNRGAVGIKWYTSGLAFISRSTGNFVEQTDSGTPWRPSNVSGTAPATAAYAAICGVSTRVSGSGTTSFDAFTWDYTTPPSTSSVVYKATQTNAGFSASTEPVWPGLGNTVVDNQVTWLGVVASRVTWQAAPILVSGGSEPTFPTSAGGVVDDNTIRWVASTGWVEEAPQSKEVAILSSKIFATDDDIVKFSATVNPLDWTTANDAGYLPTGLQTYGANPMKVLGIYRGNLMPMNSAGFQMWQTDEDPASMAFLDALPIGSTFHRTFQPVNNDSLVLTDLGFRNISIAAASTNLAAGGYGNPIDPLVRPEVAAATYTPGSIYYPAQGQYWCWFGPQVFVLTLNGKKPSWSRYVFPVAITDATLVDESLYLRNANNVVWEVSDAALRDDVGGTPVDFTGVVWFPYLDLGNIGVDKTLESIDLVGVGTVSVQIGWKQTTPTDSTTFTAAYSVDSDTLDGTPIPMPLTAPSMSLKLTFAANQRWEWLASVLNVQDDYA